MLTEIMVRRRHLNKVLLVVIGGGVDCDSTDFDGSLFLSHLTSGPVKFHGVASPQP